MANQGFGGTIKLGGATEYQKALRDITKGLSDVSASLKKQATDFSSNNDSIRKQVAAQKELETSLKNQQKTLNQAKTSYANMSTVLTGQQTLYRSLKKEYEASLKELERIGKTLGTTSKEYQAQQKVVNKLGAELSRSSQEIDDTKNSMGNLKKEMTNSSNAIKQTEKALKGFDDEADRSVDKTEKLKGGFSAMSVAIGNLAASAIRKFASTISNNLDSAIKRFDTINNFPKVMSNLGISTEEADKAIKILQNGIQGLPTTLDDAALAVQRFTSKNGDVKKSSELFLAVNNAIIAGGGSASIQSQALEQLSQAYAKGKPDMMEWRSIQTAMPAQLKQVAIAMGYVDAAMLGEAVRAKDGAKEFDRMMKTMMKMNTEGVKGFKSFDEQARNAVGGIGTAVTNMRTAIVRGVTTMVESLNNSLKKAGFGSIGEIIAKAGKTAENALAKLGKAIEKVPFDKLLKTAKKLVPVMTALVSGFVAYNAALKVTKAINMAQTLLSVAKAITGVTKATKLAGDAQKIYNMIMAASPIGLAVTAVAALTAGTIALVKVLKNQKKELSETDKVVKNYNDSMNELAKTRRESLNETASEFGHYQSLLTELKSITDANGKVKKGYEERAQVIATTLNEALGTEIKLNNGIIENYKGLEKEIQKVIDKKKAEAFLNAHKAEYEAALTKEKDLWNQLAKATKDADTAQRAFDDAIGEVASSTGATADEIWDYYRGITSAKEMTEKFGKDAVKEMDKAKKPIQELGDATVPLLEDLGQIQFEYEKNQKTIENYDKAVSKMQQGHYDAVQNILGNTVEFNNKMYSMTEEAYNREVAKNNEKYEIQKLAYNKYIEDMKSQTGKYTEDEIKKMEEKRDRELKVLEQQMNEANNTLKAQWETAKTTTEQGVKDEIDAITGKNKDFNTAGKSNIDNYASGISASSSKAQEKAKEVGKNSTEKLKQETKKSKTAGEDLAQGVSDGVNNKSGSVYSVISGFGAGLLSRLKSSLKEKSPSRATREMGQFLMEGLSIGVKSETSSLLKQVGGVGKDVLSTLSGNLSGAELSPNMNINSNINSSALNNQNDMVNAFKQALSEMKIEMDDVTMAQFVDKTVAKTIYS